jgi:hypothetical protein
MTEHDFTKTRWGHNVEFISMSDDGRSADAFVFGPHTPPGDYLILKNGEGTTRYQVVENKGRGMGPHDMRRVSLVFAPRTTEPEKGN